MKDALVIHPLEQGDCEIISRAFSGQGWNKPLELYERYFREQSDGTRVVLIAEWENEFAGYVTVEWESHYPPFREQHIPEIVDLNVLRKFQRRGIAAALMDKAERQIARSSAAAGIGVGLTADYGAAQILYVRRNYIPDGRGISQRGRPLTYGGTVTVDDDLVLYLTKLLR